MASYVAMEKRDAEPGAETVFVRDGFAFWAFAIPFVWFLWHRMWIEAIAALVLVFVLAGLDRWEGMGGAVTIASLLVSLLIGLEAGNLRVAALRRKGWHMGGVCEAANRDEAEMRYMHDVAAPAAEAARPEPAAHISPAARVPRVAPARPPRGLFDDPIR